jgi:hypothetical protein
MSLAASMLAASVPDGSVDLLPLAMPLEGELLDFTYVPASKHLFFRIHIRPQPQFTYGQCMAYSDGTLELLVPVGAIMKFPCGANYLVAQPESVELIRASIGPEVRLPTGNTSAAKRVCVRPLGSRRKRSKRKQKVLRPIS